MEEALLPENKERRREETCKAYMEEVKNVNGIAIPMIVVTVSQYLSRTSPIFMLGHLGELSLSGASIATSLCNVTGFSVLFGMSSALETLCGQAYGAGQYQRLGTYTYGAIICLFLVCIPVSLLWIFADKLLLLTGQDLAIATEAGKYAIWLIPTLFPYAILQSLVRFLQTQSLILPMLLSSVAALCFQLLLCWVFIFKLNFGNAGAALSIAISYWLNAIFLALYVKYSSTCKETWVSLSKDVFQTIGEFFRFAIPSAVMVCLEWWSFELVVLLYGLLPNPKLEASVLSICFTVTSLHYHIPFSFGAAVSTRVSNELGAGNPWSAKVALCVVVILAASEFFLASIIMFGCRSVLGYAFSYEKEVVDYVKQMTPLLCLSVIMDSLQAILSGYQLHTLALLLCYICFRLSNAIKKTWTPFCWNGVVFFPWNGFHTPSGTKQKEGLSSSIILGVARGSGWQHLGAYVNLGAYYLVGIPVALIMGFVWHLRGLGLWSGLIVGATVQSIMLSLITSLTNWEKQAIDARQRILKGQTKTKLSMN